MLVSSTPASQYPTPETSVTVFLFTSTFFVLLDVVQNGCLDHVPKLQTDSADSSSAQRSTLIFMLLLRLLRRWHCFILHSDCADLCVLDDFCLILSPS
jgi:hypothetical protein